MTFEPTPRFAGCPPICLEANLPYFADMDAARKWHQQQNPRGFVTRAWKCKACEGYHYHSLPADPAGGSSGTTRTQRHYQTQED